MTLLVVKIGSHQVIKIHGSIKQSIQIVRQIPKIRISISYKLFLLSENLSYSVEKSGRLMKYAMDEYLCRKETQLRMWHGSHMR